MVLWGLVPVFAMGGGVARLRCWSFAHQSGADRERAKGWSFHESAPHVKRADNFRNAQPFKHCAKYDLINRLVSIYQQGKDIVNTLTRPCLNPSWRSEFCRNRALTSHCA